MLQQINPYNEEQFKEEFSQTDIFKQLSKDYDEVRWDNFSSTIHGSLTPRRVLAKRMFTACTFFYLKYLTEINPDIIYDIGCGSNVFKNYIPNIIGIDPNYPDYRDMCGTFDSTFVTDHENEFQAAYAINSLHFVPITEINQRLSDFIKVIKPGGRGFITINSLVVHYSTPGELRYNMGIHNLIDNFNKLIELIEVPNVNVLVCDFQDSNHPGDEFNGDIRIVFEKPIQNI